MKVELRPLEMADAPLLARLADNKKIADNLRDYFPHPYHRSDALDFIKVVGGEHPVCTFGITYGADLVGVIGLVVQKDVYRESAEIGYWLGAPYWGKGIATKAVALVTHYGFETLRLNRIFTGVFSFNKASMRVLEKNGFTKEGIFKRAVVKNGITYDEHRYAKWIDK